jgi:hypothetical protein
MALPPGVSRCLVAEVLGPAANLSSEKLQEWDLTVGPVPFLLAFCFCVILNDVCFAGEQFAAIDDLH